MICVAAQYVDYLIKFLNKQRLGLSFDKWLHFGPNSKLVNN